MDKNNEHPLKNRRKERFCRLYADTFWGDPAAALNAAGYLLQGKKACEFADSLFDDPEIRARIVHLRARRIKWSLADEAWIRDLLIEIATGALKDSDRIRALTNLAKILQAEKAAAKELPESDLMQIELPGFEEYRTAQKILTKRRKIDRNFLIPTCTRALAGVY